jgi:hypothetical protein
MPSCSMLTVALGCSSSMLVEVIGSLVDVYMHKESPSTGLGGKTTGS